ncbi:hypothetical protein [uncultured Stenotrophomonas sp.]|uniref:hypothetical protein n=1 Tax=uncultured Stenotrophomonas sp. TaxID=165438 RepID=UPI0025F04CFA|nr:hypothetical protein [uncultured Stenotrophomonas sp.]
MESKWISLAGVVGTAITVILAVAVPLWQRETSELSVTVVSKANLNPAVPDGFAPQVSLSIDGKQVQQPHYSVIEVENSGSRAILAESVEEPLQIRLKKGVIVSAEVISAEPDALKPRTRLHSDSIEIVPALLNSGDRFQVGVISAGGSPSFIAEGRIADLRSISVAEKSSSDAKIPGMRYLLGIGLILCSGMLTALGVNGTFFRDSEMRAAPRPAAALVLSFVTAIAFAFLVQEAFLEAMAAYPRWLVVSLFVGGATGMQVLGQAIFITRERRIAT